MSEEPRPVGRPSKYDPTKLPSVIELMSEGASIVEVACLLEISRATLYEWIKQYPDFSDTIKRGTELSQCWWERVGRTNLHDDYQGSKFNSTLWYMNMKNRFKWSDKQEIEQTNKIEIVIDGEDSGL